MYNIDESKLRPGMVIHTPTFEQMQAVCSCTTSVNTPSLYMYNAYKKETCVRIQELDSEASWGFADTTFYKETLKLHITPFEDILVNPSVTIDWKTTLLDPKCCVKVTTASELETLSNFLGKTVDDSWLDEYNPIMIYNGKSNLSYSSLYYATEYKYKIYEFSEIFPPHPIQEPSMPKYKVGDTFKNSKGTTCTISAVTDFDTYKYKSLGGTINTTTHNINKYWTKIDTTIPTEAPANPTYNIGDRVKVRADLGKKQYYAMFHSSSTKESITTKMKELAGKTVTIKAKQSYSSTFKWLIKENDNFWTDEMFDGLASETLTSDSSIPLYLDRTPQVGDYVHRDKQYISYSTDKKHFLFKDGNLRPREVVKVISNEITLDDGEEWTTKRFNVINPKHTDHPDYVVHPIPEPTTTTVATATIAKANPKPTTKDKPMAKQTLKDNISTQIIETKEATINAAELKAGQLINKQAIKLIKPQLPMMVRGFADHPAASVVLANVIGLALKQYAPENPKLAKVSSLMLNAAAFDTIDSFNIDAMVDKLVSGIKLPAGVSIDE